MGIFSGIKDARANFGSNYVKQGHYVAFVRRVKLAQNRRDEWFVAMEMIIMSCMDAMGEPTPHVPGETCSRLFCNYGKGKDYFLPNIKAMVSTLMDVPVEEVEEEACDLICSEDQPMAGMFVEMQNRGTVTQDGGPFTLVKFTKTLTPSEVLGKVNSDVIEKHLTKEEQDYFASQLNEDS